VPSTEPAPRHDAGQTQHCLQLGTVTGAQRRKTELPGIAQEHDPACHPDHVTGAGVRFQALWASLTSGSE
jgi:hypothetical protein